MLNLNTIAAVHGYRLFGAINMPLILGHPIEVPHPNPLCLLPPSGITQHSMFGQSQTFQILTKHIGKTISNYETKYMQYENIFYDNSNDGYFIL
jgi:hypothetical protein